MNLKVILKMLGVKVSDGVVAQIEAIIPQVPGVLRNAVETINATIKKADERFVSIEDNQQKIMALLLEIKEQLNGRRIERDVQRDVPGGNYSGGTTTAGSAGAGSDRKRR
jgi:hypothetical protein